ncbi:hypothetical protein [Roseomonas sp. 18066]|uniref:hypothetical protein n=1 Tax=Roseomonas sp. 18066 TaxID=2681412 RepID=UPI00135771A2|nr:hypothetical protein [Roseomonas sp. 18066]
MLDGDSGDNITVWNAEGFWGNDLVPMPDPVESPEQDAFQAAMIGYYYENAFDMAGTPGGSMGALMLGGWAAGHVGDSGGGSVGTVTIGPIETVSVEEAAE